jgi:hypothetical protein
MASNVGQFESLSTEELTNVAGGRGWFDFDWLWGGGGYQRQYCPENYPWQSDICYRHRGAAWDQSPQLSWDGFQ